MLPPKDNEVHSPGVVIPEHSLLKPIGRGSYGEVWLARNTMGVYRAVKIVRRATFRNERPFERELRGIKSFEPISRSHPGLLQILQAGRAEDDSFFYYVMELADDVQAGSVVNVESYVPRSLSGEMQRHARLPLATCLDIGIHVADAIQFLHDRNLAHRDVKPGNILFVNGRPKLADVGMVAPTSEAMSLVGTEGFIPLEGPGQPQADIFALGKVLYEISSGRDRLDFPALPEPYADLQQWSRFLELNKVLLKACEPDRTRRYQRAQELADDLRLVGRGHSVIRLHALEARLRRLKRVVFATLIVAAMVAWALLPMFRSRRIDAEGRQRDIGRLSAQAIQLTDNGEHLAAANVLIQAQALTRRAMTATESLRLHSLVDRIPAMVHFWKFHGAVADLAFSPDSTSLLVTHDPDRILQIDLTTLRSEVLVTNAIGPQMAQYHPNGRSFVYASADHSAHWLDLSGKLLGKFTLKDVVFSVAFDQSGTKLVAAGASKGASIWSLHDRSVLLQVPFPGRARSAALSSDATLLAIAGEEGQFIVYDTKTGNAIRTNIAHTSWVFDVKFDQLDARLLTASFDRSAKVWDRATGALLLPPLKHRGGVRSLEFVPDQSMLLSASYDARARLWNAVDGELIPPALPQSGQTLKSAISPDGRLVATGSSDGSVRIYDLARIRVPKFVGASLPLNAPPYPATNPPGQHSFVFQLPDSTTPITIRGDVGRTLALATTGDSAIVGAVQGAHLVRGGELKSFPAAQAAAIADGTGAFALASSNRITIHDTSGQVARSLFATNSASALAFSSDGKRLASGFGHTARIWNVETGAVENTLTLHGPIHFLAFSPDGKRLIICESDQVGLDERSALLFDATTGKQVAQLRHRDGVLFAAFSRDSKRVATASEDFSARVWDATTGKPVTEPLFHEHQVPYVAFSNNGLWLATASRDKRARIWEIETGSAITPRLEHCHRLAWVAFAKNDSILMTQSDRGNRYEWPLTRSESIDSNLVAYVQIAAGAPEFATEAYWARVKDSDYTRASNDQAAEWHAYRADCCVEANLPEGKALNLRLRAALLDSKTGAPKK